MIELVDDGTLDIVLECDICNERMRYNWNGEEIRQEFDTWAIQDANEIHVCDEDEFTEVD